MGAIKKKAAKPAEHMLDLKVESLPEGGYLATSDDLPGLVAQGRTIAETLEIAQDVARRLIESYLEHGDPLPAKLRHLVARKIKLQVPVLVTR
jgi:antitoxin HicB